MVLLVLVGFAMGVIITIAEPDLLVLAEQVPSIPNRVLIFTVAAGVGIFVALAILRILFGISLSYITGAAVSAAPLGHSQASALKEHGGPSSPGLRGRGLGGAAQASAPGLPPACLPPVCCELVPISLSLHPP